MRANVRGLLIAQAWIFFRLGQREVHECRAHLAQLRGDVLAARHEIEEARIRA